MAMPDEIDDRIIDRECEHSASGYVHYKQD